jgi:hypothetical protein
MTNHRGECRPENVEWRPKKSSAAGAAIAMSRAKSALGCAVDNNFSAHISLKARLKPSEIADW